MTLKTQFNKDDKFLDQYEDLVKGKLRNKLRYDELLCTLIFKWLSNQNNFQSGKYLYLRNRRYIDNDGTELIGEEEIKQLYKQSTTLGLIDIRKHKKVDNNCCVI